MILNVIKSPDPILGEIMPIFDFENPIIDPVELEKNLIDTMIANKAVGLSANQVGIRASVFVMGRSSDPSSAIAFFNPTIISASKEINDTIEGCLSFPKIYVKIKRPKNILVRWQNNKAEWQEAELSGYDAKCFCHEFDHLNAINMPDRVSQLRWALAVKKSEKIGK